MDKMDKLSDRDVRALKRQQAVLEQERKELLERVARQKTRIDSLEKKEENRSKNETTVRQTQGPLQEANGAASKQAEGAERLQKQVAESPTRPRKPESLQAELYRWLHSRTSSQDEKTQESPMLLRSPGSIKSLPVFSDDESISEDENLARKENVQNRTLQAKEGLSSRIAALRQSLASSVKKASGKEEQGAMATRSDGSKAKDPKQPNTRSQGHEDDILSLKPYLVQNRDKTDRDSLTRTQLLPKEQAVATATDRKVQEFGIRNADTDRNQQRIDLTRGREDEPKDDFYEREALTVEEEKVIETLDRLKEQDILIEQENRNAAEEEAQRRERLIILQNKLAEQNRERQRARVLALEEEERKIEQSLQRKVHERIATEQRLRALIEEENRLTSILSSNKNEAVQFEMESNVHTDPPYSIKTERDRQQREIFSNQIDERNRMSYTQREISDVETQLNRRAIDLDRKEAYLKRLEYEIQKREDSIRQKSEQTIEEENIRETRELTSQYTETESVKGDVTHLLKAYVNSFSGADPLPKNESSFEDWKKEVEKLRRGKQYPDSSIEHAIRNSFRGQARKVFINMNPESTIQDIIDKMESVFGNVASGESVIQEFYTATQRKDESVADWGIRLEDIFERAVAKGSAVPSQKDKMLRERFWRSLYSVELKNATRLHFLSDEPFESFRTKVRAEEKEMATDKVATGKNIGPEVETKTLPTVNERAPKLQHQPVTHDPNKKAIDDLAKRLQSLEKTIQTLVNTLPQSQGKDQQQNVPSKQDRNPSKQSPLNR